MALIFFLIVLLAAIIGASIAFRKILARVEGHPNFFLRNLPLLLLFVLYGGYLFYEGNLYALYPNRSSCGAVDIRLDLILILPVLFVLTSILLNRYIQHPLICVMTAIILMGIFIPFALSLACGTYFSIRSVL